MKIKRNWCLVFLCLVFRAFFVCHKAGLYATICNLTACFSCLESRSKRYISEGVISKDFLLSSFLFPISSLRRELVLEEQKFLLIHSFKSVCPRTMSLVSEFSLCISKLSGSTKPDESEIKHRSTVDSQCKTYSRRI